MRVLVVAEYYPRAGDAVLGVWAHRQALAARDAGADVRVLVLHRPIPPAAALARPATSARALAPLRQPRDAVLDGLEVRYARYVSPPRSWSYATWGAWAAPAVRRELAERPVDLIHAHYPVPAGDAARRAAPATPLVVSVHSHDPLGGGGERARRALGHARVVLANSAGTARRCAAAGAREVRVVHLGTDVPAEPAAAPQGRPRWSRSPTCSPASGTPTSWPRWRCCATAYRGSATSSSAMARSAGAWRTSPPRSACGSSSAAASRPREAIAAGRAATLFVLPSVDEALGVAYLEAMAGGVPAVGCRGEAGPEEIAAAGGGIVLVPPRSPAALADAIESLLRDPPPPARAGPGGARHRGASVHLAALRDRDRRGLRGGAGRCYLTASMNSDPGRLSIRSRSGQRPSRYSRRCASRNPTRRRSVSSDFAL